ncbi:type II toxin-antitoxin system HipA family toxin [Actinokineospora sp. NBRC 105648]|uniref:type II toxin-antitoxin system HipA family toxin n=1 Tax=Actinokineospora sp. NBRC 105648 TaxID=3032206 RepID=UPI0024A4BAF5|nr:type II toxin-antitoxin system HipA family toxin [Actinokineospora sp. NBRC 105648]GLZ41164.1 putative kinase Y4dM [Actinokineospora sp. NBRC 105648]
MTSPREAAYGVWLYDDRVGTLNQRGDYTWFEFSEDYRRDPDRAVLGLWFEDRLLLRHASHMRVHPWFSNLLLEGRLREWIADGKGVSADREMELLAQVGHDLPGAVRVLPADTEPGETPVAEAISADRGKPGALEWRFSLAGVQLKFSMLQQGDRLTLPAFGRGGDWIVKLPDRLHAGVPHNEYAMMSLAAKAGIDVPDIRLVHRDELPDLPATAWPESESWAFAVRRFDRGADRGLIHIEDLAQVRGFWPDDKYNGTYETAAALVYRRRDVAALREFARRLAFDVLITNGDAHLKNWSLIYRDHRIPTLAPAYDLVSTEVYRETGDLETLGLRFNGTKRFDRVSVGSFTRLQERLGATGARLDEAVANTVRRAVSAWPEVADSIAGHPHLVDGIDRSIRARAATLLG